VDTRSLELFLNLAETLNFSRTAEQMHMSLSAVSRSLQRMEAEIGQRLAERDKRSVRLTRAGEQFRLYAARTLSDWQRLTGELRVDDTDLRGEVSVYCSVTASYSVLSPILEQFRQSYPGIEIMLHTGDQADAIGRIQAGREDIAVAARPDQLAGKLDFLTLMHSPLQFIAPGFDCAVNQQLRTGEASGPGVPWDEVPFIVAERGLSKDRVDAWFRQRHEKPRIYAQVAGHEAIAAMVGLGLGVGVVPRLVLDNSAIQGSLLALEVEPPLGPFPVGICALSQRLENPLVRAFWNVARRLYVDAK
jgi:LysR family positive regulator for ilvC